jgi:hypothetical protein
MRKQTAATIVRKETHYIREQIAATMIREEIYRIGKQKLPL